MTIHSHSLITQFQQFIVILYPNLFMPSSYEGYSTLVSSLTPWVTNLLSANGSGTVVAKMGLGQLGVSRQVLETV